MSVSKPCPHCGAPINLDVFFPGRKAHNKTGTNRFAGMTPEQRKEAAAAMAAKRWGNKKPDPLNDALNALLKETKLND